MAAKKAAEKENGRQDQEQENLQGAEEERHEQDPRRENRECRQGRPAQRRAQQSQGLNGNASCGARKEKRPAKCRPFHAKLGDQSRPPRWDPAWPCCPPLRSAWSCWRGLVRILVALLMLGILPLLLRAVLVITVLRILLTHVRSPVFRRLLAGFRATSTQAAVSKDSFRKRRSIFDRPARQAAKAMLRATDRPRPRGRLR